MNEKDLHLPASLKVFQKIEFPFKYGFLDRLYGRRLAKKGIDWVKTPVGIVWKLDLRLVVHRWILYGSYDAPFLKWVKNNVPENGIIVDSGANIGQMTLYFAQYCKKGKVLAFEPDQEAANWILTCIKKNNSPNIELIRKGLGKDFSTGVLHVPETGKDKNLHAYWSYISTENDKDGQNILITRLDKELSERKLDKVDLWKLDVEGFEIPALEGAEDLLKTHRIKAIYAELAIKKDNHIHINNYLSGLGYHCHYFNKSGKLYKAENIILDKQSNGLYLPMS